MSDDLEETAARLARGARETLVERLLAGLRFTAGGEPVLSGLGEAELRQAAEQAAEHADGLQWRRALVWRASQQLGLSLPQALSHPAVDRAAELLGVPSAEEALAALRDSASGPAASPAALETPPPPPAAEPPRSTSIPPPSAPSAPPSAAEPAAASEVVLEAIHLEGVANLEVGADGLQVRLSPEGFDILRRAEDSQGSWGPGAGGRAQIVGRVLWEDVRSLEVGPERGIRRRRRSAGPRLRLRTVRGEASFEVPGQSAEGLRAILDSGLELREQPD